MKEINYLCKGGIVAQFKVGPREVRVANHDSVQNDNLKDLRESALRHVRYNIGGHFNYNDFIAVDDIYHMNAADLSAVATMTNTEMAERWACEYRAPDNEPPGHQVKNE